MHIYLETEQIQTDGRSQMPKIGIGITKAMTEQ